MGHLRLWVAAARGAALGQAVDAASLGTPPAPLRAALCDKPFDAAPGTADGSSTRICFYARDGHDWRALRAPKLEAMGGKSDDNSCAQQKCTHRASASRRAARIRCAI